MDSLALRASADVSGGGVSLHPVRIKRLRKAVACACWERSGSDAKKPNTRKAYYSASSSESTSSPLLFQYLEEITVLSL